MTQSQKRPLLSVIVPCYNAEDVVELALRALARQDVKDIEVLAIDDRSTDGTREILAGWERRDARIRVIDNERNLGIGATRNAALRAARGEWIGFLDSDDWISRSYFANLIAVGEAHDLEFVRCDHTRVRGTERERSLAPETRRGVTLDPRASILPVEQPAMVDYPYNWAGIYRRSFLSEKGIVFQELRSAEDRIFIWRIHCEGRRYRVIDECGYFYSRDSNQSLTRVGDRRQLDFLKAIRTVTEYVESIGVERAIVVKAHRQALALLAFHYYNRGRLSAETWYELKKGAAAYLATLDPKLFEESMANFGEGRREVITLLESGAARI